MKPTTVAVAAMMYCQSLNQSRPNFPKQGEIGGWAYTHGGMPLRYLPRTERKQP